MRRLQFDLYFSVIDFQLIFNAFVKSREAEAEMNTHKTQKKK